MKFIFVDFYILWESKRIGFVRSVIESKKYVFAGMRKEAPSTHFFFYACYRNSMRGNLGGCNSDSHIKKSLCYPVNDRCLKAIPS